MGSTKPSQDGAHRMELGAELVNIKARFFAKSLSFNGLEESPSSSRVGALNLVDYLPEHECSRRVNRKFLVQHSLEFRADGTPQESNGHPVVGSVHRAGIRSSDQGLIESSDLFQVDLSPLLDEEELGGRDIRSDIEKNTSGVWLEDVESRVQAMIKEVDVNIVQPGVEGRSLLRRVDVQSCGFR